MLATRTAPSAAAPSCVASRRRQHRAAAATAQQQQTQQQQQRTTQQAVPLPLARRAALAATAAAFAAAVALQQPGLASAKSKDYGTYFVEPANGATVTSPVKVKMAVKGLDIKPAAEGLQEGTGHHHLIVDGPASLKSGADIPFDDTHLHFGKGQTEDVTLAPGKHTLTLQFANALHKSYGPGYAKQITITVK